MASEATSPPHAADVRRDLDKWYVVCTVPDCGYVSGPHSIKLDAELDADEHALQMMHVAP